MEQIVSYIGNLVINIMNELIDRANGEVLNSFYAIGSIFQAKPFQHCDRKIQNSAIYTLAVSAP
ncbi:MAG: hypothetical protein R3E64_10405 [Halioglobus sp.]